MGTASSSVDKDTDSTMRYRLGMNYKDRRFFIPSPAKKQPLNEKQPVDEYGYKRPDYGNNEDFFFDSRTWLDSDCEDDFFSVNGEFTPSRGSTPNHQTSAPLTPRHGNPFFVDKFPDSSSEPSPTGRKKLGDLFRETLQAEQEANAPSADQVEANKKFRKDCRTTINDDQTPRSSNGTPCGVTPSRDPRSRRAKVWKTYDCCLPSGPWALMRECRR